MRIAELSTLDRVLVVGSFLRKDHPLIAQRLRQSAKRGTQVNVIHSTDDDLLIKSKVRAIVAPSLLPSLLAQVVKAVSGLKGVSVDAALVGSVVSEKAQQIAQSLVSGSKAGILLGNFAQQHPQAATLHALGSQLASVLGGTFGFIGEAANSVGAYVAQAVPGVGGFSADAMLRSPRRAYLVVGAEPELDCADGAQALAALRQAASVVVLSPFKSQAALEYADVLLPVSPFTETSGTFVNAEGRAQSFYAAVKPLGETRPAWKVLRVLGNLLEVPGFDYSSSEDVRSEALNGAASGAAEFVSGLDNRIENVTLNLVSPVTGIERVTDIPIYFADAIARRAPSLQKTRDSIAPGLRMNAETMARLNVAAGDRIKVGAGGTAIVMLPAELDATLPDAVARVPAAHPDTVALGAMFANLTVEKA